MCLKRIKIKVLQHKNHFFCTGITNNRKKEALALIPLKHSQMSKSRRQDKRALEATKSISADLEAVRTEERLG